MLAPRDRANRETTTMDFGKVLTKEFLLGWEGRINRAQYWAFVLVYFAAAIVGGIVDGILGTSIIGIVLTLALLFPSICVGIKRWHDRDKSGWWILIGLIPIIGWIWTLVECGFLKGSDGPNRFGADPLAPAAA